jgi:hypothetical protein
MEIKRDERSFFGLRQFFGELIQQANSNSRCTFVMVIFGVF